MKIIFGTLLCLIFLNHLMCQLENEEEEEDEEPEFGQIAGHTLFKTLSRVSRGRPAEAVDLMRMAIKMVKFAQNITEKIAQGNEEYIDAVKFFAQRSKKMYDYILEDGEDELIDTILDETEEATRQLGASIKKAQEGEEPHGEL